MTPAIADEKKVAVTKIELRAGDICSYARTIKITSTATAAEAAVFLNDVLNPLIREGDELFDPMIAAAHNSHQVAIQTKRRAVGGLPEAKAIVRLALANWETELEERARDEQLRREAEARRIEAERIEREIEAIEAAGDPDAAEEIQAILEAPRPALVMPSPPVTISTPGISKRFIYSAEVTNSREFFKAIADGRAALTLAKPDTSALNRLAAAVKEGFNVPGCRLIKTTSVNSSSSRRGA